MALRVVKGAVLPAVSLEEAKEHLDVDDAYRNDYIVALIAAATDVVEYHTQRRLVTQTLEWVTAGFCARLVLPVAPVQSVTSVKYRDESGVEQTLAPADYVVRTDKATAVIVPAEGGSFPIAAAVAAEPVVVRFVAGYGESESIPPVARHLIKLLIKDFYDPHRGTLVTGTTVGTLPWFAPMIEGLRWEVP